MIIDKEMQLCLAQAVTATASTTNVLDLGPKNFAKNAGDVDHGIEFLITVDTTVTAVGAATVAFQLRGSDSANMASPTIYEQSDAIPKATLVAGALVPYRPSVPPAALRYIDVNIVVGTGPLTAGAFSIQGIAHRQTTV